MMNSKTYTLLALAAFLVCFASSGTLAQGVQTQAASALGNKDAGKTETAIGDLVADAARDTLHADIALIAASELRAKDTPFAAGPVSSGDIAALMSYPDDPLAALQIKGSQLREALEKAVSIYPQPNLGFLQVSGIKFSFDPKKNAGSRVTAIFVGGSPISDTASYRVAVTNSVANGALGYWKVWSKDNVVARIQDMTLTKATEMYLKANPRVNYSSLDRISPAK